MHTGRCLCGKLEFEVEGPPNDVINCHCNFCQRATGSGYLIETTFDKEKFRLLKGEPQVYEHASGGSGKLIYIHFCSHCGTKTHMLFARFPSIVGIFSGAYDEKDWFGRNKENTLHFFLSTASKGTVLPAGYEVYDAHYWQSDGSPDTPIIFQEHTLVTGELRDASLARLRRRNAKR